MDLQGDGETKVADELEEAIPGGSQGAVLINLLSQDSNRYSVS